MKCFYHNDMDGICAASVVLNYEEKHGYAFSKKDFFEVDYTKPLPDVVSNNEKVYIVDYSFTEPTLDQFQNILNRTTNIVWCDHHISSLKLIKKYKNLHNIKGLIQDKISGAALTYMFLYNVSFEECPMYIKLVSDYDCWIYKYGDMTTYFKLGIESLNMTPSNPIWDRLLSEDKFGHTNILDDIIHDGNIIKKYIDSDNEYYLSNFGYESELAGYKCYVINKKSNSWIFGDKINQYPFVVVYVFDGTQYTYSLFSTDKTVDCSKVAESFGGGGHFSAAGFTSKKLLLKECNNER